MKKILLYVIVLFTFVSFSYILRNDFTDAIIMKLDNYETKYFPEKIYLHTDKPYYSLEESIWFTGYLVNAVSHKKSTKSRVIHVDLINDNDSIVASKNIYIDNITGAGDFKISKKNKPGTYLIRAYTNEMRNMNSSDFFRKEIEVLATVQKDSNNINSNLSTPTEKEKLNDDYQIARPDLKFFPEGGYLINGLQNKIAVKTLDPIFKDKIIDVAIVDNHENEIFSFKTMKFGLGLFMLTPETGKTYTAIVNINGSEERYDLPIALKQGFQLSAKNNGNSVSLHVSTNTNDGLKSTFLVAHQRGKLLYAKKEKGKKSSYKLNFPTDSLNDGVVHFTLFNKNGNPVAERLLYIDNPKNNISIQVKNKEKNIGKRQKITLSIDALNQRGKSVSSNFSMSVRDMQAVPQNNFSQNIKTYLLLNSDLRGTIENPGYFFETSNHSQRRYLLDLIMMTNGWRKFSWQALLEDKVHKGKYTPEKGININGRTKYLKKPFDYRSTATRISFMGNNFHQESQQSDTLGNFAYGPFVFYDSIPTLLEARLYSFDSEKYRNRNVSIILNNSKISKPSIQKERKDNKNNQDQIDAYLKISKYIEQINLEYKEQMQQLEEVIVVGDKKDEKELRNEEFDNRTFHGSSDKRLVTEDIAFGETLTVFQLLQRISGVIVTGTNVTIRGGGSPRYYLDGMEIDSSYVSTLSGIDIDFIDVLTGADAAIYSNSGNGIISMYSKTGVNAFTKNIKRKPGIIDFQAKGFYTARHFFAPDHINGFEEMSKADIRTTLHWEPDLRITPNEKTEISFFSCDIEGDYVIDIQGISDTGIPFYNISTFTVK